MTGLGSDQICIITFAVLGLWCRRRFEADSRIISSDVGGRSMLGFRVISVVVDDVIDDDDVHENDVLDDDLVDDVMLIVALLVPMVR